MGKKEVGQSKTDHRMVKSQLAITDFEGRGKGHEPRDVNSL